jgi:hypothetical protein
MRRLPHGGTSRPPMGRPGSAYGRAPQAGPPVHWRQGDLIMQARRYDPVEMLLGPIDLVKLDADTRISN